MCGDQNLIRHHLVFASMRIGIAAVGMLAFAATASAASLPQKKAQSPKSDKQVCEIEGRKGYRPVGSDTCIVVSGYVQVTVGGKAK